MTLIISNLTKNLKTELHTRAQNTHTHAQRTHMHPHHTHTHAHNTRTCTCTLMHNMHTHAHAHNTCTHMHAHPHVHNTHTRAHTHSLKFLHWLSREMGAWPKSVFKAEMPHGQLLLYVSTYSEPITVLSAIYKYVLV